MLAFDDRLFLLMVALMVDLLVGDPDFIWKRIPHPIVLFGMLIKFGDESLNRQNRSEKLKKWLGVIFVFLLCGLTVTLGWLLTDLLSETWVRSFSIALIGSIFISQKSMMNHAHAVINALVEGGLDEGRRAVSRIVGRDTSNLDESGISRAAIESISENYSDGVVAPAFWFLVFGLPGLLTYKMINTADSMIGHLNERHRSFGWATAKLDDLVNLIPSRMSGILIALCARFGGGSIRHSLGVFLTDARKHVSPNAGFPEAAMAGALNISLLGPRTYGSKVVDSPWINKFGRRKLDVKDILIALRVFLLACSLLYVVVMLLYYTDLFFFD